MNPKNPIVRRARELRKKSTDSERFLWQYLSRRQIEGFKFRRQQPIGKYIVDFVNFERKLIIELDGGQHAINKNRDIERDKWLEGQGFKVLRFWDNELFENTEGVLTAIQEALLSPSPRPPPIKGGGSFSPTSDLSTGWVSRLEQGLSSVTILILMVTLATVAQVIVSMASSGHQSYSAHLESTQAFYVADAGLEWVQKAITFVSGSAEIPDIPAENLHFDVQNNSGTTVTVTGLTASWAWGTPPADTTQFYQEVRIQAPPTYNNVQVWDYGTDRAGNREAVTFNTGPTVTLSNGSSYEFRLRKFRNDETGGSSEGNMSTARLRVAFNFTPNSISIGRGSFVISVPTISSGNALYASTATIGSASRRVQAASVIYAEFP